MNRAVIIPGSFIIFIVTGSFIFINEKGEGRKTQTLIKPSADQCTKDRWPDPMPYLAPNSTVGFPIN